MARKPPNLEGLTTAFEKIKASASQDFSIDVSPQAQFVLPTVSTLLNCATGIGGLPSGSIVTVKGPSSKGKSGFLSTVFASAIQQDSHSFGKLYDSERRWNFNYAHMNGCPFPSEDGSTRFFYEQTRNLETFMSCLEKDLSHVVPEHKEKIASGIDPGWFIGGLDSVATLGLKEQDEKAMDDKYRKVKPMSKATIWTEFFQKTLPKAIAGTKVMLVFTNHVRVKPDMYGGGPPGTSTPGGAMIHYMESLTIVVEGYPFPTSTPEWLQMKERYSNKDSPSGILVEFYIEKSSVGPPMRKARIPYFFHRGFDDALGCLQYLRETGSIPFAGGYCVAPDVRFRSTDELYESLQDPAWRQYYQQYAQQVYLSRNSYTQPYFTKST